MFSCLTCLLLSLLACGPTSDSPVAPTNTPAVGNTIPTPPTPESPQDPVPPLDIPPTAGTDSPQVPLTPAQEQAVLCEQTWPAAAAPDAATTQRCAEHFLGYAYAVPLDPSMLDLDPYYGDPVELSFTASQLEHMASLVAAQCKDDQRFEICGRAEEFFHGMANRKTSLFDVHPMMDLSPALAKVLAGQALTEADLLAGDERDWSQLSLWKLRNAVFARHGHGFDNPDLQAFFYGPRPAGDSDLLPLTPASGAEAPLTEVDRANVALVQRVEGL